MTCKSVLSSKYCKKKEKPYPKLMLSKETGNVFLLSKNGKGTCVHPTGKGIRPFILGEDSLNLDMSLFSDYEGDVCLTNEEP